MPGSAFRCLFDERLILLLASEGRQGLERLQERGSSINLILLDLTMPGMSGEQVLQRLRDLGSGPTVVAMSGYSEEEAMPRCVALGARGFLRQPFELAALREILQAHLG